MTTKTVEPMPLEELRERLRYGSRSQVSTLEPVDLASMHLAVEALAGLVEVCNRAPQWASDQTPRWHAELAIALARVRR